MIEEIGSILPQPEGVEKIGYYSPIGETRRKGEDMAKTMLSAAQVAGHLQGVMCRVSVVLRFPVRESACGFLHTLPMG